MPIFEHRCTNPECPMFGQVREYFSWRYREDDPPCQECGGATERVVSRAMPVFLGEIAGKYLRNPHTEEARMGGHWAWRRRSSRTGKPEKVWISTWQEQARFCKEEGLYNPRDLPTEKREI